MHISLLLYDSIFIPVVKICFSGSLDSMPILAYLPRMIGISNCFNNYLDLVSLLFLLDEFHSYIYISRGIKEMSH